jgi:hypothetical protein
MTTVATWPTRSPPVAGSSPSTSPCWVSDRSACSPSGERLIALLGDPAHYGRFGFVRATELGVGAPDPAWAVHFQARPPVSGTFRYAASFDRL